MLVSKNGRLLITSIILPANASNPPLEILKSFEKVVSNALSIATAISDDLNKFNSPSLLNCSNVLLL